MHDGTLNDFNQTVFKGNWKRGGGRGEEEGTISYIVYTIHRMVGKRKGGGDATERGAGIQSCNEWQKTRGKKKKGRAAIPCLMRQGKTKG